MLQEYTLFGVEDKVQEAVAILRRYEPPEGYYLAFSGGKDSLCCYWLCKIAGVKFDAHFNFTTVDPPELIRFIRTFDDVEIHHPGVDKTMWALIVKKGFPPTRAIRYCCQELKEGRGKDRIKIFGVREEESAKRKGRQVVMLDDDNPLGQEINIIYHWTESDVWQFIGCNMIDYCSLYDEGFSRLGCVGCPLGTIKKREREFERWPVYKRAYMQCFDRMIAERKRRGKPSQWQSGEEVMQWWMYGNDKKEENQVCIEFEKEEES